MILLSNRIFSISAKFLLILLLLLALAMLMMTSVFSWAKWSKLFDNLPLNTECVENKVADWIRKSWKDFVLVICWYIFYGVCVCVCSVMSDSLQPYGLEPASLLCPWDLPGRSTGVGCHFLLQGIILTQGLNLHLLRLLPWQAEPLLLCQLGSPSLMEVPWKR